MAFLPKPGPEREAALRLVRENAELFHHERLIFFGVLPDTASFEGAPNEPPLRWFADPKGDLRRHYKAVDSEGAVQPEWVLIDPTLRILGGAPLAREQEVIAAIKALGDPAHHAGVAMHAPVLIVPRIFQRELCRRLIDYYGATGGDPSGVMVEQDGKTVGVLNDFKRRRDATVHDQALMDETRACITQRLLPEIERVFQFKATRMERYIVACYDAEEGGYFKAHRDNTTTGTAHRKFAVSINLNADEFEGGDLRFPEFGRRTYRPPTGGAVVFSCSLLHEATPVTRGARYAFLPFLYDEEGARIRAANRHALEPDVADPEPATA